MAVFENAAQLHAQGKLAEAERGYRELIAQNTNNAEVYGNLAGLCLGSERAEEAIGLLRSAIRLKPDVPQFHSRLGIAFIHQLKLEDAAAAFAEAVRLK